MFGRKCGWSGFVGLHCMIVKTDLFRRFWGSLNDPRPLNGYRTIVVVGFFLVMVLTLAIPARMSVTDDWAYYFATENPLMAI
jgi:hypothetical protein